METTWELEEGIKDKFPYIFHTSSMQVKRAKLFLKKREDAIPLGQKILIFNYGLGLKISK